MFSLQLDLGKDEEKEDEIIEQLRFLSQISLCFHLHSYIPLISMTTLFEMCIKKAQYTR